MGVEVQCGWDDPITIEVGDLVYPILTALVGRRKPELPNGLPKPELVLYVQDLYSPSELTPRNILRQYLEWEGIIGYTDMITTLIDSVRRPE